MLTVSFHRKDTVWSVRGLLQCPDCSGTPPRTGWTCYNYVKNDMVADPGLVCQPGSLPCQRITIKASGEARKKQVQCLGDFLRLPDTWSRGRPVSFFVTHMFVL